MKLKNLIRVIFGEDVKFAEVKISGTETMLKSDGEDFVIGQPVYLVEPGMEPVIVDSEAEFVLEDGRKIEVGNDGLITEISTESVEDAVEPEVPAEEEMVAETPQSNESEVKDEPVKEDMEDPIKILTDKIQALTDRIDNIQKSLSEDVSSEMEKMKKEIKMIKNEPIAEKFEAETISSSGDDFNFKNYLINLQKNIK